MKLVMRILLWVVWAGAFAIWLWWYWMPCGSIQVGYVLISNSNSDILDHFADGKVVLLASLATAFALFLRPDWWYRAENRKGRAPLLWALAGGWPWGVLIVFFLYWRSPISEHGGYGLLACAAEASAVAFYMRSVDRGRVRRRIERSCSLLAIVVVLHFIFVAFGSIPQLAPHKTTWGKIGQYYDSLKRYEDIFYLSGAIFLAALASRLIIDHLHWTLPPDDMPLCERCGYDLRGSIPAGATQCPECGEAIPHELKQKQ